MASSIHADVARYHQRLLVARVKHLPIFLAISSKSINPETITRSYPDVQPEIPHFGFNFTPKGAFINPLAMPTVPFSKDAAAELLRFAFNLPDLNSVFGQIIPTARPTFHTQTRQVVSKLGTRRRMLKRLAAQGDLRRSDVCFAPLPSDIALAPSTRLVQPTKFTTKATVLFVLSPFANYDLISHFLKEVAWWSDSWISANYDTVTSRYVKFNRDLTEVSSEDFFAKCDKGVGDMLPAHFKIAKIVQECFTKKQDVYLIYFSNSAVHNMNNTNARPDRRPLNVFIDQIIPFCKGFLMCEVKENQDSLAMYLKHHHGSKNPFRSSSQTPEQIIKDISLHFGRTTQSFFGQNYK
ncbi:MAG: hypothetical protein AABX38_01975 [Candidatus Micrarchaeota archaeon]